MSHFGGILPRHISGFREQPGGFPDAHEILKLMKTQ